MDRCCEPQGYDVVFGARQAARDAARYRRKGLSWAPRRTVELFRDGTITGRTLLEIGGGVGALQVELMRAGVERARGIELSGAYEQAAADLLREAGLTGRVERLVGDAVGRPELAGDADIVVLHSVVCCYPDAARLLALAASSARRHLVMSYPRETWWLRGWAPVQNLYPLVRRSDFRFRVHPHAVIEGTAELQGLGRAHREDGHVDRLSVFDRTS